MRRRSYVQNVSRLRRKLRRFPEETTIGIKSAVSDGAKAIELDAKLGAPVDEGVLRDAIDSKVGRDGMSAQIGIRRKRAKILAYYAHFVEFGTRGYSPGDRRANTASGRTRRIRRVIPPRSPRPFLYPAFRKNKKFILRRVRRSIKDAIRRVSVGRY